MADFYAHPEGGMTNTPPGQQAEDIQKTDEAAQVPQERDMPESTSESDVPTPPANQSPDAPVDVPEPSHESAPESQDTL